ncbi:MAG: hypothetical protein MUO26_03845 [Methanotrichaceae archaeon]|nr:hypothetical protein [Methanotrichaceae archaeon]
MKAVIAALFVLLVVGFVIQLGSASGIVTLGESGMMSGIDIKRMEAKMTQSIQQIGMKQPAKAGEELASQDEIQPIVPANESTVINVSNVGVINRTELELIANETVSETTAENLSMNMTEIGLDANESMASEDMTEINLTGNESSQLNVSLSSSLRSLTEINTTDNESLSFNASAANFPINATELNSNSIDPPDSQPATCKSCHNLADQKIGGSTSAAVNGFWGTQSSQHNMGESDINSKTFLSGDFEVDKNVQFSDRAF